MKPESFLKTIIVPFLKEITFHLIRLMVLLSQRVELGLSLGYFKGLIEVSYFLVTYKGKYI